MSRRREELVDLALDVLEREGLEQFGIGSLARAAGVRPPSLYKHFAGLDDIEHALISRGFREFADAVTQAEASASRRLDGETGLAAIRALVATFVRAYRAQAFARPQLYRLMTGRTLDRGRLEPGAEGAAMAGLLTLLGEDGQDHPRARAAWAWAHGLISLEIAGRFPAGADVEASWTILIDTVVGWADQARR